MNRLLKRVENEAAVLRNDLKILQYSRLMKDPAFHHMYVSAVEHHRHLKLSHLSGKSEDIIRKLITDTYLYSVLVKMLLEVEARLEGDDWEPVFEQVKNWYNANSHKLASRPTFSARKELPTPHLISISIPTPRESREISAKKKAVIFPSQKSARKMSKKSSATELDSTLETEKYRNKVFEEQDTPANTASSEIDVAGSPDSAAGSREDGKLVETEDEAKEATTEATAGEEPVITEDEETATAEDEETETADDEETETAEDLETKEILESEEEVNELLESEQETNEIAEAVAKEDEETEKGNTLRECKEPETTVNNPQSGSLLSRGSVDYSSAQEAVTRGPPNTPAYDQDERCNDFKNDDTKGPLKSQTEKESSEVSKPVHPISSYVTPFQAENVTRNSLLKRNDTAARHSAHFQNTPSLRTLHLVLQQHSHGARYQLWREEDEITLRERRVQGEIILPTSSDEGQDQLKKKQEGMESLKQSNYHRQKKLEPEFAEYDTETFLRVTEGYYPLHTEKPSRLASAQSTLRQDEVFIKEAIQALGDVSSDMMSNQRKEMTNVRWDERIEPIRLISHMACPPSRESHYYGPESTSLLLLDENTEPETNRVFLLENAADWRGKITPPSHTACRPKTPFTHHTFVKRLLRHRNRLQSQRVRPLSAPAPPADSSSPILCASVPDTGRCTPPSLKPAGIEEAVKVQHLGGTGEDPWEAWMRRTRMRRHPIRKRPLKPETPASTEYLSLITPATALGVFGVVDNLSSEEAIQHQAGDASDPSAQLIQSSQSSFGESSPNIAVPDTTPITLSFADMEQIIRTHSARPKSAANPLLNKKSPAQTSRLLSNMPRTPPSIPSGRDFTTLNDLVGTSSADNFSQTKYRLPKYAAMHPSTTKTSSRPNSSKCETKGSLRVVGMTVNTKSDHFPSSGLHRAREENISKFISIPTFPSE